MFINYRSIDFQKTTISGYIFPCKLLHAKKLTIFNSFLRYSSLAFVCFCFFCRVTHQFFLMYLRLLDFLDCLNIFMTVWFVKSCWLFTRITLSIMQPCLLLLRGFALDCPEKALEIVHKQPFLLKSKSSIFSIKSSFIK